MQVQMHLQKPEHNQLVGVPIHQTKKINRFYEAAGLEQQGKLKEAEQVYIKLLDDHFGNVAVMAALGMNYAVQEKHGLAHGLLSYALNHVENLERDIAALGVSIMEKECGGKARFLKMKRSEIMNAIGTTWKHENKTAEARYWFQRAKDVLGEPNADIENNLATLYINEGKPEGALVHLNKAIEIDKNHAQARWNRSLANLEMGNYEAGFAEYNWGKRAQVRLDREYAKHKIPEWDGSKGKRIIVYGEQGIGDEIMFASVLPDLIRDSEQVVFDCHKKLHRLFCSSFPTLDIYGTREDEQITWPIKPDGNPRYQFDAKIAIGDLPRFYRKDIRDFPGTPYIQPTTEAQLKWAQRLDEAFGRGNPKPVIGINWIGGHKKTRVEVRSLKLEQLLPILKQDAHFVSLQYTPCEEEIFEFEQKHGIKIHHWPEACYNEHYDETGGLVANLDLVITCCSSVVHLAGSMGIPAWVATPSRPAWRYRLDLDYMPWYGETVTLFRQKPDTVSWGPVISEISDALSEMLSAR